MPNTTWSTTDKSANITLSGGNLTFLNSSGANSGGRAAGSVSTGKYYWEVTVTAWGNAADSVGVAHGGASLNFISSGIGLAALTRNSGVTVNGGVIITGFGVIANGTTICIALDAINRRIWFRLGAAGNWNVNASYNPASNTGGVDLSPLGAVAYYPAYGTGFLNDQCTANFGDAAFTGAVPAGFTAGFPAGVAPLVGVATQAALEEWGQGAPVAQITQVATEVWSTLTLGPVRGVVTQAALEQWAVVPATGAVVAAEQYAVSVIT